MTDAAGFERRFEERLHAYAAVPVRPIDYDAIAHSIVRPRAWRRTTRPRAFGFAASIAAAVIAVGLIGSLIRLPSVGLPPGSPASSASPTASLSSSPSQTWIYGPPTVLEPGTYVVPRYAELKISLTVPSGWMSRSDFGVQKIGSKPVRDATLGIWTVASIYVDPCKPEAGQRDPGPTADDLALALASQPGRAGVTVIDETLSGRPAKRLTLQVPEAPCGGGGGFYRTWMSTWGDDWLQPAGERDRLWILDVDGVRIVVDAIDYPETSAADRAELEAIIASIRIGP